MKSQVGRPDEKVAVEWEGSWRQIVGLERYLGGEMNRIR